MFSPWAQTKGIPDMHFWFVCLWFKSRTFLFKTSNVNAIVNAITILRAKPLQSKGVICDFAKMWHLGSKRDIFYNLNILQSSVQSWTGFVSRTQLICMLIDPRAWTTVRTERRGFHGSGLYSISILVNSLSASLLLNIFLSFEVGIAHAIANFKWKENTSSLKN